MNVIQELKKQLLENPENICTLLEEFEFEHITLKRNEIRFARNSEGGQNIRIRLENNDYLNVTDYARSEHCDIVSYIIKVKHTDFRTVLTAIKRILHLSDDWRPQSNKREIFGGVYSRIINKTKPQPKVYNESILNNYLKVGNTRFLKDHLSLESQRRFEIMYNVETDRIVIPIRNTFGDLCGTKCRRNYDTDNEDDPKYIFEYPCQKSLILYGVYQNYPWLYGSDKIFIFEAEKSVIAADSYGYQNAVSIMGNVLSEYQAKELLSLNAKEYCFMLDEGLDPEITYKNTQTLKSLATMREFKITWFDWRNSLSIGEKESPTDGGKDNFYYILNNEIQDINELEEELAEDEI